MIDQNKLDIHYGKFTGREILAYCDHTFLKPDAVWEDIKKLCDEGKDAHTATVCIPQSFVKQAFEYTEDKIRICTVVGFPTGYTAREAKVFEAGEAVKNGAYEIDMVMNIGDLKSGKTEDVVEEIKAVKEACDGKLLKVIIETCLLTDDEKKAACAAVINGGADYVKTSTGFSTGGATLEDVRLLVREAGKKIRVKAAGGIRTIEDAAAFLEAGARRIGTSSLYKAFC